MWPHSIYSSSTFFKYTFHLPFPFRSALPTMPSTQSGTSREYDISIRSTRSERPLSPRSSSRKSVPSAGLPPSQHFALATGMANPFAGHMSGFRTSRAKSASAASNYPRTSLDRVGISHLRRCTTTSGNIKKDVRAESISEGSTTAIKSTRNANTSQSKLPLPYPISYRLEVLDRRACYFVYMA